MHFNVVKFTPELKACKIVCADEHTAHTTFSKNLQDLILCLILVHYNLTG